MIKTFFIIFDISKKEYLSLLFWRALIYPVSFLLILYFKMNFYNIELMWYSILFFMVINSFFSPFCIHFFEKLFKEKATKKCHRAISISGEHGNIIYYLLLQFCALFIVLFLFWKLRSNSSLHS